MIFLVIVVTHNMYFHTTEHIPTQDLWTMNFQVKNISEVWDGVEHGANTKIREGQSTK